MNSEKPVTKHGFQLKPRLDESLRDKGVWAAAFWFGVYVLWLTVFPMSGALLPTDVRMAWFTLPHALALLALGRWLTPQALNLILPPTTLGTALVTMAYAFGALDARAQAMALLVLGLTAAPLSIRLGLLLGASRRPVIAAAIGLCLGNLCGTVLELIPEFAALKVAALACLIPGLLWPHVEDKLAPPPDAPAAAAATPIALWRLLPFIALFQTVSGLMYAHLWPAYRAQAFWPGVELLAYVLSVLIAARYVVHRGGHCLLGAVGLAVTSFVIHHAAAGSPLGSHLSLFLMLAAAGIVDLLLLSEALARTHRIRAYGYAIGVMVLGIALGETLAIGLQNHPVASVALSALALLNLATAALFLRRETPLQPLPAPATPATDGALGNVLPAIAARLSEQELRVLQAVLHNRPYREIAEAFGISESSVKTYMQRIYRKLGVYRRQQLLEQLATPSSTMQAPQRQS